MHRHRIRANARSRACHLVCGSILEDPRLPFERPLLLAFMAAQRMALAKRRTPACLSKRRRAATPRAVTSARLDTGPVKTFSARAPPLGASFPTWRRLEVTLLAHGRRLMVVARPSGRRPPHKG
jgi:hypothetical protein